MTLHRKHKLLINPFSLVGASRDWSGHAATGLLRQQLTLPARLPNDISTLHRPRHLNLVATTLRRRVLPFRTRKAKAELEETRWRLSFDDCHGN
jgi:hypothetical protein